MSTARHHSNIQVAIVQVDKELQAADTTLHDLQHLLIVNKSKISQLVAELAATQKQVEHCARTIPQAERQKTRADLRLRQLKEHADKVAKELAAERLVQDYLEELKRDDEEGERRLKEYLNEVLRRDAEGYGDSDSDSDWSVLSGSVESLKRSRTPQSPGLAPRKPSPPVIPVVAPASGINRVHTPQTPRGTIQEALLQDQAVSQPVEISGVGTATPLKDAAPAVPPKDDADISGESDEPQSVVDAPVQQTQETEISIMLSESPGHRPNPDEDNAPRAAVDAEEEDEDGDEDDGDGDEETASEGEQSVCVTAKDDETPQSSRASSPQQSIISAYSRASPTPEQRPQPPVIEHRSNVMEEPQSPRLRTDLSESIPTLAKSRVASPTPIPCVYPPTSARSTLVIAPTPVKPISLAISEPQQPEVSKYFWAPGPLRDSQLLKFEEVMSSTKMSRVLSRSPRAYGPSGSDSDSPRGIPVMSPTRSQASMTPREGAVPALSSKRVPPPVTVPGHIQPPARVTQPASPIDSKASMTAKDPRDRLERDPEPSRIDYARQVEAFKAQAAKAKHTTMLDRERQRAYAKAVLPVPSTTSTTKRLSEEVAASRSKYALQRPNVTVAGPRPRDPAVAASYMPPTVDRQSNARSESVQPR